MFRSLALAFGITLCILGAEFLVVEKVILAAEKTPAAATGTGSPATAPAQVREFVPEEWMPWSLLSAGSVVILYSFTVPRRVSG